MLMPEKSPNKFIDDSGGGGCDVGGWWVVGGGGGWWGWGWGWVAGDRWIKNPANFFLDRVFFFQNDQKGSF